MPTRIDEGTAFTAGLLQGIGELVMHAGMPEAMVDLVRSVPMLDLRRPQAERDIFEYSFAKLGAALASEWSFPTSMIEAIEHQVLPLGNDVHELIADVVHIASWRSRAAELSLYGDAQIKTYPGSVGLALGVDLDTGGRGYSAIDTRRRRCPPRIGHSAWHVHSAQDGDLALCAGRRGSRSRGHREGCGAGCGCSQLRVAR